MKLTILLTVVAILQVSASTFAQKITLSEKNAALNNVFKKISDQTGYDFIISTENLKQAKPITINVQNEELRSVLDKIFSDQPLEFVVQEKIVIVSKKEKKLTNTVNGMLIIPLVITGKVTDTTGTALFGATVKIKGNNKVVITDSEGLFTINANEGDELDVSFIGYNTVTLRISGDNHYQNIILHQSPASLMEVKVISNGYQSLPAERITGSFSQPIKEEYNSRVAPDVLSKLAGITSGLVFNANTNTSKSGQLDINIRGRSTIFANDEPLIVVDNFAYNGDINNINPNDVESITVLKDASAASIWGVRAGNGVIVITTKKGNKKEPLSVGFSANLSIFNKPDLYYNPNQLDGSSYIGLEQYLFGKGYYDSNLANNVTGPVISPVIQLMAANKTGTLSDNDFNAQLIKFRTDDVNGQLSKYFYQKAVNQQYALNLSGGSAKALYYFSAGYDNNVATIKNNASRRITINSQNNFYLLKNLELAVGVNVVKSEQKSDNTFTNIQNRIFPYTRFRDANGKALPIPYQYNNSFIQSELSNGFLDWSYVPLDELGATDNDTKLMDIRLSTGLRYTVIKGLTAEVKYQYQNSNNQDESYLSQQTWTTRNYINQYSVLTAGKVSGYNVPLGGILNLSQNNNTSYNLRGTLNYNNTWNEHNISALAGYELSQTNGDSNTSVLYGYDSNLATFTNIDPITSFSINPIGNATIPGGLGVLSSLVRLRSSFANAAYTYKDRYTLSASARIDGSNFFGVATNQKSLPLWSGGAKWDIAKESFYKLEWLPNLALRASYGYNGNLIQSITGVTTFRYASNSPFTNLNYAQVSNLGNPDLRWEKTAITNIAVDFGGKNNVIAGSLDVYFKRGTDLLGFKSFPENSGITSLEGNYSNMKGRGFDLTVSTKNLNGSFKWFTTLLISHATDQVTEYDVIPQSSELVGSSGSTVPNVGRPVYGIYGYKWGGLDATTGNPIGFVNGQQSQNYSTIITTTSIGDLEYVGSARPTYFGGLNNRFTYKGFSVAIQLNYKLGYYFIAPTINYSQIGANGNAFLKVNKDYNMRWQHPGDEKNTHVPSLIYPFNSARDQFYQFSTVNIQNAGNIRLQDISLSYDFSKSIYRKLPFNNIQIFAYANNVAVLWKANHINLDPDAIPGPGDSGTFPIPRSIAIGIKGNF